MNPPDVLDDYLEYERCRVRVLRLQAALGEALDMLDDELMLDLPHSHNVKRSAELRSQFLDNDSKAR